MTTHRVVVERQGRKLEYYELAPTAIRATRTHTGWVIVGRVDPKTGEL